MMAKAAMDPDTVSLDCSNRTALTEFYGQSRLVHTDSTLPWHERLKAARHNLFAASARLADDAPSLAAWFLVAIREGREHAVCEAMKRAKLDAWVPEYDLARMLSARKRGGKRSRKPKRDLVKVMAFPGYLALRVVPSANSYKAIMGFDHVIEPVTGGIAAWDGRVNAKAHALTPIMLATIRDLEARVVEECEKSHWAFPQGTRLRVKDGPFMGFQGVVAEKPALLGLVWIDLEAHGRALRFELPVDMVEAVDLSALLRMPA